MSKQLPSLPIEPLDARVVKGMVERMAVLKSNSDKASEALTECVADYKEYMGRLGVADADILAYRVNIAMSQLEPLPVPAPPKPPTKSPDAGEPPAPFREAETVSEIK